MPSASSRRASCRPRTRTSSSCAPRRRPTSPSRPCWIASASSRSEFARIPTCCTSIPTCSRRCFNPTLNRGSIFVQLKARPDRLNRGSITDVQNRLRRSLAGIPGIRDLSGAAAELAHRQSRRRGALSIHPDQRQSDGALRQRPAADRKRQAGARVHRCHQRSDPGRPATDAQRRSRCARPLRRHHGYLALHALFRLRHASRSPPSIPRPTTMPSSWRRTRRARSTRACCRKSTSVPARASRCGSIPWRPSRWVPGPVSVARQSQLPAVTITFNLAPGYTLGEAVAAMRDLEREVKMPATITGQFAGTAQVFESSFRDQPLLIAAAILTIYIVLGILYESFIHPITILSGLPSASLGALADPLAVRRRAHHHRRDRHHSAGRHRQKERHHDGGLRHRGPSARRHTARSHPRGLPAALPADHDDHHGGAVRHACRSPSAGERGRSCANPWV